jgi:hypothetical protein
MKRNILSIALLVVLAGMAVSCQKENLVEPQTSIAENGTMYTVKYAVNGVTYSAAIHNDAEEQALMQYLLSLSRDGNTVVFFDEGAYSQSTGAKDTQVHTTTSEANAGSWSVKQIHDGYQVSVTYNSSTGEYVCIATK